MPLYSPHIPTAHALHILALDRYQSVTMTFLASVLFITSTLAQHAYAVASQQIQADLINTLSRGSEVVFTTDHSYSTNFTQRWSIYSECDPTYNVAAKPATTKDVQTIVKYAAQNNVPFLATGGGHGYSTSLSGLKGALNVDLSKFRKVSVNGSANTLTVGAAAIFADMYNPLYAAGKQMRGFPAFMVIERRLI